MMGSTLSKTSRAQQTSHKTNRFTTDTFGRQNCAGIYLPHKLRVDRQRQYELVFTPIFLFIAHQMTTRICHANGLGHAGRFSSATSGLKFGHQWPQVRPPVASSSAGFCMGSGVDIILSRCSAISRSALPFTHTLHSVALPGSAFAKSCGASFRNRS